MEEKAKIYTDKRCYCGNKVEWKARGRGGVYCCPNCRYNAHRARQAFAAGETPEKLKRRFEKSGAWKVVLSDE